MSSWEYFLFSVGNKNDDPNSKVVETTDAQKFAEQMGINLFETSAKENINVEEVTHCLCRLWPQAVNRPTCYRGINICNLPGMQSSSAEGLKSL